MPRNENLMPIIRTFTEKAELILATPKAHHKSELDPRKAAFIEGLGTLGTYRLFITGLSFCYGRGSDGKSLAHGTGAEVPSLFGLFARLGMLAPFPHQFMPLDSRQARVVVDGLMNPLVSLVRGKSRLDEGQLAVLWQAFRSGPALTLPFRLATTKTELDMEVVKQWPTSG